MFKYQSSLICIMEKRENYTILLVIIIFSSLFIMKNLNVTGQGVIDNFRCTAPRFLTSDGDIIRENNPNIYCSQNLLIDSSTTGGCIVIYEDGNDIYAINSGPDQILGNDAPIKLTQGGSVEKQPQIGNNGKFLLFLSNSQGTDFDVYLKGAGADNILNNVADETPDDDTLTRLTMSAIDEDMPRIPESGDSRRIIFLRGNGDEIRKCVLPPNDASCSLPFYDPTDTIVGVSRIASGGKHLIALQAQSLGVNKQLWLLNIDNPGGSRYLGQNGLFPATDARGSGYSFTRRDIDIDGFYNIYYSPNTKDPTVKITNANRDFQYGVSDLESSSTTTAFTYLKYTRAASHGGSEFDIVFKPFEY